MLLSKDIQSSKTLNGCGALQLEEATESRFQHFSMKDASS
jgi:hypothetical protein